MSGLLGSHVVRTRTWSPIHSVGVGTLWLGAMFLFVIAADVRLRSGWLPRAVLGSADSGPS